MSDIDRLVATVVDAHRPADQPPFEALAARGRRRRVRGRLAVAAGAALVAAVPVLLLGTLGDRPPDWSAPADRTPAATAGDPSGPTSAAAAGDPSGAGGPLRGGSAPEDATEVTACGGPDRAQCRTIGAPSQVRMLATALNAAGRYPYEQNDCGVADVVVTLTFRRDGREVRSVDVLTSCGWWTVRGDPARYNLSGTAANDAMLAYRAGRVVHDCGVTTVYALGREDQAPEYLGRTSGAAAALAREQGDKLHVAGRDGTCAQGIVTDERDLRRVRVYLEHDTVVSARRG